MTRAAWVLAPALMLGIDASALLAQELDPATRAALAISDEPPVALSATTPRPKTSSGSWTWTAGPIRYDGAGNIAAIGTQSFLYDTAGRLVQASIARQDQPGFQVQSYSYDAFGNMTSRTLNGSTQSFSVSGTTNRLTAAGAVYDAAGNLKEWQNPAGGPTYKAKYDTLGMVQELEAIGGSGGHDYFVYTAADERIWTYHGATNSSRWTIRGLDRKVLRDYVNDTSWRVARDYVYRGTALLAAITPTETIYFSLDHLGTPRVITNDNRVRVGFHHYYPFGEEWLDNSGTQEGEPMKFTGHERDLDVGGDSTGLDYMHARYYSARWGRFLSVDPAWDVEKSIRDPQRWNRYAYVVNNPLRYTDPDGRETNPVTGKSYIEDKQLRTNSTNPRVGKYGKTRSENNWKGGEHSGVDIAARQGTPLVAPIGGTVIVLKDHPKGGNVVFIETVRDGHTIRIGMAHMDSVTVKNGQKVEEGDPVGTSGDTGNAKGLPAAEEHVHLSVRIDGETVDPQDHFKKNPSKNKNNSESQGR